MPHVHWLNCEKKRQFRIYGIHINWGQINETKNEITELSSKCQFKNYYIYGAMLKYVFQLRLHVSSLYKCPFNTILSFFLIHQICMFFSHRQHWNLQRSLKLFELNFFASFNADDERKTYISDVSKYTFKSSRWNFSTILYYHVSLISVIFRYNKTRSSWLQMSKLYIIIQEMSLHSMGLPLVILKLVTIMIQTFGWSSRKKVPPAFLFLNPVDGSLS